MGLPSGCPKRFGHFFCHLLKIALSFLVEQYHFFFSFCFLLFRRRTGERKKMVSASHLYPETQKYFVVMANERRTPEIKVLESVLPQGAITIIYEKLEDEKTNIERVTGGVEFYFCKSVREKHRGSSHFFFFPFLPFFLAFFFLFTNSLFPGPDIGTLDGHFTGLPDYIQRLSKRKNNISLSFLLISERQFWPFCSISPLGWSGSCALPEDRRIFWIRPGYWGWFPFICWNFRNVFAFIEYCREKSDEECPKNSNCVIL